MRLKIATYISSLIDQGRRRIKALVTGSGDVQTAYESMPFGIDGVPPANYRAIYAATGERGRNVIIGYINVNQLDSLNAGDNRIYSVDSGGSVAAYMTLLNNGEIELLGTGNFLVRFNQLESGFNQLKSDHNTLIGLYNAHVHPAPGGATSPTTSQATASTADITEARIDRIRTL